MERKFYVEWNSHNAKTGSTNYKQTKEFATYDSALKEFCNVLATYIEYGDLDHIGVILFDSFCNVLDHRSWDKAEEPAPEPNEETEGE